MNRKTFIGIVLLTVLIAPNSFAAETADVFRYPVGGITGNGWLVNRGGLQWKDQYNYGGNCGIVYHPGIDFNKDNTSGDGDLGQPVYAVANGQVLQSYYEAGSSWGNLVLIRHVLPSGEGEPVFSLYAHLDIREISEGDQVVIGQQIGTVGKGNGLPAFAAHLHFEIRKSNMSDLSKYPAKYFPCGLSESFVEEHYYNPEDFILSHGSVGLYSDGFHTDGSSQAFVDTFNRHSPKIGWPINQVHKWTGAYDPKYRVWLQDFQGDMNAAHFGTDGKTAIILRDWLPPNSCACPSAYLVKEGMWGYYKTHDGPYTFGEPFTEEITHSYADSPHNLPGDAVSAGEKITVQKFMRVYDSYGQPAYDNERRTLVYNNTRKGDVVHFPVGEFSINEAMCPRGEQIYVYVDSNPANDIAWPIAGMTTPTGKWFTKPGSYNFVRHQPDGQRASWGVSAVITEGNEQTIGSTTLTPMNLTATAETANSIRLTFSLPGGLAGYNVRIYQNSQKVADLPATENCLISGLSADTSYCFQVSVVDNASGVESDRSIEACATTLTAADTLQFTSATYSVNENGGSVTLTVTRADGSSGAVGVSCSTVNGTATDGRDYTATSSTLNWGAGDMTSKTITVPILDDAGVEGNETFTVTLWNPTGGAALGDPSAATVTIADNAPTVPLADALGYGGNVTTGSGAPWFGQTAVAHDGVDAGQSASIGDNSESYFYITVTGPGTISFWWKVSSERFYDKLRFYDDTTELASIHGEVNWETRSFYFGPSSHELRWSYSKDSDGFNGSDVAWVDQVVWTSCTAPAVTSYAINNGAASTTSPTVTLNNSCSGSPTDYMASESSSFIGASWQAYSTAPSFTLSAGEGTKTVYFKVKNGCWEPASVSDLIDYVLPDTTPPTVVITSPTNGQSFSTPAVAVSGTATDSERGNNGVASVTVNGFPATGGSASGANTANWTAAITLVPGANTITVVARDTLNNATTQQITVTDVLPIRFAETILSNGVFRFVLNGPAGSNYVIQVSSNLVNWLSFSTNTIPAGGSLNISDPGITNQPERFYRAVALDQTNNPAPANMALIPSGLFTMGDSLNDSPPSWEERVVHTVYVSAFYMDKYEVTKALWDGVYQWATNHGYSFDNAGSGKAANHPVHSVNWYDMVKWCNARSEKEGRTPAYYTSVAQTTVYRSGQTNVQNDWVKWNAGYRLPTEAEWEKAAQGGASGHRFSWSDTDDITHSRANYISSTNYVYDTSLTRGYHPTFNDGVTPYTSPVGFFATNGYGLYDMTGNVWEWCWDRSGPYSTGSQTDPRGPTSGDARVLRGGAWDGGALICRSAVRDTNQNPWGWYNTKGFRSALPSGQ